MHSARYNNLHPIWCATGGKCHLCHKAVNLATYGLVGMFGPETASVDHLIPQAHGGGDERANLRIAHQGCNSRRGTKHPVLARLEASGRSREPLSSGKRAVAMTASTIGFAALGASLGAIAANKDTASQKQAALVGGITFGFLGLLASAAMTA